MVAAVDRLPPHNLEAEQSVLGSLLIDRDAIIKVASALKPDDFFASANGIIYQAIVDLYNRREPTDFVTLTDELERKDRLESVGGIAYLSSLLTAVPTAVHVEYYGKIVERTATLRRLIDAGAQIVAIGYQEAIDTEDALDSAEQTLFAVSQRRSTRDFQSIADVLDRFFDQIDYMQQHRGDVVGVPTGYADLDQLTGGLQKSDLIIVAARPSVGKTAFALGMAYGAAVQHGRTVGVFSLEMAAEQLVQRLLSTETGVDSHRLRLGQIDDHEWDRISRAFGRLAEAKIFIDDSAGMNVMEVRSKARRLQAEHGLDLLIVDYLQLMHARRSENRVQEISEISRGLKGLARELNVPVIALSQLSRAVETRSDHRPMLSDLRESGCLTGESLVYLPDRGEYRAIGELVGTTGFRVLALNGETWKLEPRMVTNAFATGRKPVYRLRTRLGRKIRATANHKFLTVGGWRRLDELTASDRIALPRMLPAPDRPQHPMSGQELALLGHLIGDGCTLARQPVRYTTADQDLAEIVAKLATDVFGSAVVPRINQERSWIQVYLTAAHRLTHGVRNPIAAWLGDLGVFNLRSHEKRVPTRVFGQTNQGVGRFLRHLWSTDGSIWVPSQERLPVRIYYASSSERLARDVQSLALRLGINAVLSRHSAGSGGRDQWHLDVFGGPDQRRFLDLVGAVGKRKEHAAGLAAERLLLKGVNTNRDVVPARVWRLLVVPSMQQVGMTTRQVQAALGHRYCGTGLYRQNLGRERAARLARVVQSPDLGRLAESDVYWDEVVSIEEDGEEEVFDLTVEGLHNFVANDIVVHNSIEQDADIVMFIYRDEVYDPNTERKGIAEIIVAKHRNGPVGSVNLRFFEKTARFADLELYREPGA